MHTSAQNAFLSSHATQPYATANAAACESREVETSCAAHSFANQHAVKPSTDMQLSAGKHSLKHTSLCLAGIPTIE